MMNTKEYCAIFMEHDGIMRTKELSEAGVSYVALHKLIEAGNVEKIRYGYYQWQDERAYTEASIVASLFPEGIICGMSALMYYDYTDRVPQERHLAVDNRTGRRKFKMDSPKIKPHFIEQNRLNIGTSEGKIDGIRVKIYMIGHLTH